MCPIAGQARPPRSRAHRGQTPYTLLTPVGARERHRTSRSVQGENRKNQRRVDAMNTQEAAAFLGRFPPFDALPPDELEAAAEAVQVRSHADGENLLIEDGEPAEHFYVVREGAVELVHQEEVVDVLEPGESFGHPSLLTGMAPAFTVRAHGGCVCYAVPREQALAVLDSPAGARHVALTLRERLTRTGHTVHALPQLTTLRV